MRDTLIRLPKTQKRILALSLDLCFIWISLYLAFATRYGFIETRINTELFYKLCILAPSIIIPVYIRQGLYRAVLRYMGLDVPLTILRATFLAVLGVVMASFLLSFQMPRSIPFLFGGILALLVGLSRYLARYWLVGYRFKDMLLYTFNVPEHKIQRQQGVPVAIYGAGGAGCQLVAALDRSREYKPVAFIDDDPCLEGRTVLGRYVFTPQTISELLEDSTFEQILLAIPSATEKRRKEIIHSLEEFPVPVLTMPAFADLASGKLRINDIQEVQIEDLLGREPIAPDEKLLFQCVRNQSVMITGAGGSIGSELCRQIIKLDCCRLILFEHSEFNLYRIEQEMSRAVSHLGLDVELIPILGSVNDPTHLLDIMKTYGVETVYHAAAYKHVPIVEHNIAQGVRNNIFGTLYTAQAAILSNVKNFVLVSTDKAVRPTNVMGATKRMAELVLQAFSTEEEVDLLHSHLFDSVKTAKNTTRFTMVRFGNVLGSSGSVIPLFREQIASGGPVTVTHPEITRYFMTIPEASQLVIQAGSMGRGGDVFVLDMGDPVKILDLAKRMIKLSGYSVKNEQTLQGDIEIQYTGLRPGEKLYEELLIEDNAGETQHLRIFRATEEKVPWGVLSVGMENILQSVKIHNYDLTRTLLAQFVSGFMPNSDLVDLLNDSVIEKKVNLLVFDKMEESKNSKVNEKVN